MDRHFGTRRLFLSPDPVPLPLADPNDYSFDYNMVIILSALLCTLICVLGLNSIIRYAIKYFRRNVLDRQHLPTTERIMKDMKIEAMSKIPMVIYASGVDLCGIECPICLGDFDEGDCVRILPTCNHSFHAMCIDKWLASRASCPMCRQLLFE